MVIERGRRRGLRDAAWRGKGMGMGTKGGIEGGGWGGIERDGSGW